MQRMLVPRSGFVKTTFSSFGGVSLDCRRCPGNVLVDFFGLWHISTVHQSNQKQNTSGVQALRADRLEGWMRSSAYSVPEFDFGGLVIFFFFKVVKLKRGW